MKRLTTDRRSFLASALAAGAYAALAHGPAARAALAADGEQPRRLPPLKVSPERRIRTVVGLRPFRDEGFVLTNERMGEKLVVHNYGHGGAGVTLSWGVALLAAEQARNLEDKSVAVIGSGAVGLATARVLQRRGKSVTVYARELPPETTSNVAGALWMPTSVYDPQKATPEFLERFRLASRLSNREFQTLVGPEYGVRWTEVYTLRETPEPPGHEPLGGAELYPAPRYYSDARKYFGFPYARLFSSMHIEPHTYLRAVTRDFYAAGGRVVVREFKSREEVAQLPERVVFNCTGLGARALFGDRALSPVRGQLEVMLPQPELDYCYLAGSLYMFPRRDGVILGGTFQHNNYSLDPDAADSARILEGNAQVAKGLRH
jgi:glycine/D-amino acid oxidase-like deaminating enzyme